MKKRKNKDTGAIQEFKAFSFISLFNPTIDVAADLMNVSVTVVEEWLSRENLLLDEEDHLTEEAIDFLSQKYVERLHKYFDNCLTAWDYLDDKERVLFDEFKSKYGKFFRRHIVKWDDIDVNRIAKDFRQELGSKAYNAYFDGFEAIDFSEQIIAAQEVVPCIFRDNYTKYERGIFLYELSHSLYYGSRIKTKVPKIPESRHIVLEILQENRFHIFSGESDSNALIDAILSSYVKQSQLAIASVFGYLRHKNSRFYGAINKTKTHCFS